MNAFSKSWESNYNLETLFGVSLFFQNNFCSSNPKNTCDTSFSSWSIKLSLEKVLGTTRCLDGANNFLKKKVWYFSFKMPCCVFLGLLEQKNFRKTIGCQFKFQSCTNRRIINPPSGGWAPPYQGGLLILFLNIPIRAALAAGFLRSWLFLVPMFS